MVQTLTFFLTETIKGANDSNMIRLKAVTLRQEKYTDSVITFSI